MASEIIGHDCGYALFQESYQDNLTRVEGLASLLLFSPPYCDARNYGAGVSWTFEDYQRLGDYIKLALKPGGQIICVLDAPVRHWRKGFGTERSFIPSKVMIDWGERVGLRIPDRMAYSRMGSIGGYISRFRQDWELIIWGVKLGSKPFFDKKPLATDAKYPYKGKLGVVRDANGDMQKRIYSGWGVEQNKKHRGTLWDYGTMGHGHDDKHALDINHVAPYALKFAEDAVQCFCPPGGLVVDPFVGSGTSAVAALKHGRKFIGGDLYCRQSDGVPWIDVTKQRLLKHGLIKDGEIL